MPQQAPA